MNTHKKIFLSSVIAASTVLGGTAVAAPSEGEASPVLACFYECKPYPGRTDAWQEVTSLMVSNQTNIPSLAKLTFMDGHENAIANATTILSPLDLDEINVCRTMRAAGITPPSAGLVEIAVTDVTGVTPAIGTYAWIKNLIGKFFVTIDEPFQGLVTSVAKTECRVVPSSLNPQIPSSPAVPPIFIENTGE